jgi:hypothetical protein
MNETREFDNFFQKSNDLDGFLKLPLSNETIAMPDELKSAFKQIKEVFQEKMIIKRGKNFTSKAAHS